ncbi:hypothetical protein NDU88_006788 [Pleurodeles waltl]|uniref:Secreted protein n=1 Tax=Pleurodeles waltl TaxID=8319 RepID=A0AAV7N4H6_PLEWA|nr:hypothetical protein NDU88_006788 [Pleurodeles waltl]
MLMVRHVDFQTRSMYLFVCCGICSCCRHWEEGLTHSSCLVTRANNTAANKDGDSCPQQQGQLPDYASKQCSRNKEGDACPQRSCNMEGDAQLR